MNRSRGSISARLKGDACTASIPRLQRRLGEPHAQARHHIGDRVSGWPPGLGMGAAPHFIGRSAIASARGSHIECHWGSHSGKKTEELIIERTTSN